MQSFSKAVPEAAAGIGRQPNIQTHGQTPHFTIYDRYTLYMHISQYICICVVSVLCCFVTELLLQTFVKSYQTSSPHLSLPCVCIRGFAFFNFFEKYTFFFFKEILFYFLTRTCQAAMLKLQCSTGTWGECMYVTFSFLYTIHHLNYFSETSL